MTVLSIHLSDYNFDIYSYLFDISYKIFSGIDVIIRKSKGKFEIQKVAHAVSQAQAQAQAQARPYFA